MTRAEKGKEFAAFMSARYNLDEPEDMKTVQVEALKEDAKRTLSRNLGSKR